MSTTKHFDPFADDHMAAHAKGREDSTLIVESISEMISSNIKEKHSNSNNQMGSSSSRSPSVLSSSNGQHQHHQLNSTSGGAAHKLGGVAKSAESVTSSDAIDEYLSAPALPYHNNLMTSPSTEETDDIDAAIAGSTSSVHVSGEGDTDTSTSPGGVVKRQWGSNGNANRPITSTPPAAATDMMANDSLALATIPSKEESGDSTNEKKTVHPSHHTRRDSHDGAYVTTKPTRKEAHDDEDEVASLSATLPPHVLALRPRGFSRSPADLPPIHNLSKLLPPLQIKLIKEIQEKEIPPPLKKNAKIPTTLPSEMLMPILLRCDFCQKFDSICSNCNKKWKGIVESRRAVLMNNIKTMQHVRKMGIYFGTILYGAQDFFSALLTSQPQLKNWCARIGNGVIAHGRPADIQMKLADERGRLFGLHVAMAFGKLQSAKTLLAAGSPIRRSDSKTYPTEFLPSPIPDDWDDMLQAEQPYVEFRMAERARVLRREGDFVSAALEYNALLSLNPNNEHAHCGMAKMMFDQGKYEECLAQCQRIIEMDREGQQQQQLANASITGGKESVAKRQTSVAPSVTPVASAAPSAAASPARDDGSLSNQVEGAASPSASPPTSAPPPPPVIVISGGIQWAEFGLSTVQELQKAATNRFHETCHAQEGPALKRCGCVITAKTVVRIRKLPFKLIRLIIQFGDCSTLWGWWRATTAPLLRNVLERSGAVLCDESIGEMLSQEEGYAELYEKVSKDKPDADAVRHIVLQNPLRPLGLQVKAMADFHTFVIRSSVAGTNPNYKEPDTSVFFPKARKPMEKMKRAVAVKEFCVHRAGLGAPWLISGVGEWEVDEAASLALQAAVQRKKEAEDRARAAAVAGH